MDCAEANTTVERYFDIQRDMLTELLTGYGPIARMWWDMYVASPGRSGRSLLRQHSLRLLIFNSFSRQRNASPVRYYLDMGPEWNPGMLWPNLTAHARALAPQTLLLPGPDGCLVGGETGSGSYPCVLFNDGPTGYGCQGTVSRHARRVAGGCASPLLPRPLPPSQRCVSRHGLAAVRHAVAHLRTA